MDMKLMAMVLVLGLAGLIPAGARAQSTSCTSTNVTENFTGASTNCSWYFYSGACLTAGSSTSTTSPGQLPACAGLPYYGSQTQLGGNSGNLNVTPDTPLTGGALRLTNDANNQSGAIISNVPFSLSSAGLQVTFTTETYEGNSGSNSSGGNSDGADGISFFLQDASVAPSLGDYGGSLGYTCSNQNNSSTQGYDGMIGAYIGLGIDEYGNFLDGTTITNAATGATTFSSAEDNTSTGYGKLANRVGMRGAGSTAWSYLSTNTTATALMPSGTALYYPSTLNSAQRAAAVRQACMTGYVWDYRTANNSGNGGNTNNVPNPYGAIPQAALTLPNYAAIPNAFAILSPHKIANESALYRGYGTASTSGTNYGVPITYNLSITTAGLLSLSYSYNGGNFLPVITGQDITASNGALPASVRFGFAGSTGGSRNIHEIMCFQAQPQNSASSSAGLNQKQSAKVQTGTQVYFAFYNANNWTGALTSQYLDSPDGNPNHLQIDPSVNWDASCVLTGLAAGPTCARTGAPNVAAEDPDSGRTILSWDGGTGIPFKYAKLSSGEQSQLNFGDPAAASGVFPPNVTSRLEYLRGVRSDEQNARGVDPNTPLVNPSGFRARTSVLGDIVDSSPTWVGPPATAYPVLWKDSLHPSTTMPENSGTTYAGFQSTYQGRMNVVYAGANDGFLHGFRSGYFNNGTYVGASNSSGAFVGTANDGQEVLAYMPGYVVNTINSSVLPGTTTPNPANDYTNPQYAHRFNVDGTPGTGDLFYNGGWHTWLVGGLAAGGSAIYALDVTDPTQFSESNAGSLVIGEWHSSLQTTTTTSGAGVTTTTVTGGTADFTCPNNSTCGNSLGRTFGTPQIRRFHNDPTLSGGPSTSWGAVFGNGSNSYNGDAGIFVMIANNSGAPTIYYLSTGVGSRSAGTPNGIYYVTPADLDGDHITDYVYAGDLQGNVWRFDLTSTDPTKWAVTSAAGVAVTGTQAGTPIYSTGNILQPITTKVVVASIASSPNPRVLVEFGTGQQTPFTNNTASTYATTQQYLIGVWDWNLSAWDSQSTVQYVTLSPTSTPAAPGSTLTGETSLQVQTITGSFDANSNASAANSTSATNYYYRTVSSNAICWADNAACTTGQYGWYLALSSGYPNPTDPNGLLATSPVSSASQLYEQVIFNPTLQAGAFIVNTTIPPSNSLANCSSTAAGGWTMAINPATGGAFSTSFFGNANHSFLNINNQAVSGIALSGTGSPSVVTAGTSTYIVTQTIGGTGAITQINPPGGTIGSRLTWIQRR